MRTLSLCLGSLLALGCSSAPSPDGGQDASAPGDGAVGADGAAVDAVVGDGSPSEDAAGNCPALPTPMAFAPPPASAVHMMDAVLRMNHLQAEATHNSYHVQGSTDLAEWAYTHAPLGVQLATQGVRSVELDLHWSARCGRHEVYHVSGLDDRTTCRNFTDCLLAIRAFSQANPGHHPIFVHVEPKDPPGLYDEARLVSIEREILSVFDPRWVITPDEVRGGAATLAAGIMSNGWPTLGRARGRVLFYMDDSGAPRAVYTHGGRDLTGRLLFVDSAMGDPFAGVMVLNDPVGDAGEIARALAAGFIVRTRADSDTLEARMNDRTKLERALASGAQLVSTDFPARVMGTEYWVEVPMGTPSRCNPVTAPSGCASASIEDPARLRR